jgi:hypothetical protein
VSDDDDNEWRKGIFATLVGVTSGDAIVRGTPGVVDIIVGLVMLGTLIIGPRRTWE